MENALKKQEKQHLGDRKEEMASFLSTTGNQSEAQITGFVLQQTLRAKQLQEHEKKRRILVWFNKEENISWME